MLLLHNDYLGWHWYKNDVCGVPLHTKLHTFPVLGSTVLGVVRWASVNNLMFPKLDLFSSSGEGGREGGVPLGLWGNRGSRKLTGNY